MQSQTTVRSRVKDWKVREIQGQWALDPSERSLEGLRQTWHNPAVRWQGLLRSWVLWTRLEQHVWRVGRSSRGRICRAQERPSVQVLCRHKLSLHTGNRGWAELQQHGGPAHRGPRAPGSSSPHLPLSHHSKAHTLHQNRADDRRGNKKNEQIKNKAQHCLEGFCKLLD